MRNLWVLLIVVAVGFCLGCGKSDDGDKPAGGDAKGNGETPATADTAVAADSPQAAAKAMLEAFKKGNPDGFLAGVDLKGVYDKLPEDQRAGTYEEMVEQMREGMRQAGGPPEGFDYKFGTSRTEGDITFLKISIKEGPDAEWDESEIPFKKIDGKWKITGEGFFTMMTEE
ncbi:MAG: hypothetical protein JW889_13140 [Verrucomicrobia bacterium]|nr:hypothetical protein [Verrucomicrobiota bacterium]